MVLTRSGRQSRTPNSGRNQRNLTVPKKELLLEGPKPSKAANSIHAIFLKEEVNEAKRRSTNSAGDANTHSALAAGNTYESHQGASESHIVPHVMSSLWNVPIANMELDNISNELEERVSNFLQSHRHDDPSPTEKNVSVHTVEVHKYLATVNTNMNSAQKENRSVASNDIINAREDLVCKSHQQQSRSFNLTEIAQKLHDDDLSEVDSVRGDSSLASVKGYSVKPEHVNLLSSILYKQGDIAANCTLKSGTIRSFFMQYLCDVIHKLWSTSITGISESELEYMLCYLNDIEGACVEVGWLKKRVREILEAKKAIPMLRQSSELKQVHAERKAKIQRTKKQLEVCKNEIAIKEAEIQHLKEKFHTINCELAVGEEEAAKTEKMISEYKVKLRHIVELESLAHGLV